VLEIAVPRLGRGTIEGGSFSSNQATCHLFEIQNLFRISLRGETLNYRPFASPHLRLPATLKTAIAAIIVIIIIIIIIIIHV